MSNHAVGKSPLPDLEIRMKTWVFFAILSMIFAGLTSVIAKVGLTGISGEMGLGVRTVFVFMITTAFALAVTPVSSWSLLNAHNYIWLGLSGVTTSLSWIFYYKALKEGTVSTIALIDKGSIVVAILLAWLILHEPITPKTMLGGAFVLAGIAIIALK